MQIQHTMNCQYGAGEQCLRAVFAQDTFPYVLCSAPQAQSCTTETYPLQSTHVGDKLEGKLQMQLSWMRLQSMKPHARESPPGQVTALQEMVFLFWKGKAARNVT